LRLVSLVPKAPDQEVANLGVFRDRFAKQSWPAPSFLLNLVATATGEFTGATNSSRDISNELDFQALIGYRMAADGILTTAKTARLEQYTRSSLAPLALVSESGNFSGIPAVNSESAGPIESLVHLLVSRRNVRHARKAYPQPWIRVHSIGGGGAFRLSLTLTRLGWRRVLVEAGPTFSRWLLARSVIRFVALTIVGYSDASPLDSAKPALDALGIQGAVLDSAFVADGNTLFTVWSELDATPR